VNGDRAVTDEIWIRPAGQADAAVAAPLVHMSGPAAFDQVFTKGRRRAEDFLRRAFADGAGEFGWRVHVVAERAGEVVGVGAGYDGSAPLGFMLAAARQILGCYGPVSGAGVIMRGLGVERVIPPPSGDMLYLAHLGVAPELRSRGVGRRLVDHLLERGAGKGYRRAALDVSTANPRAQALYERLGFTVTREHRSALPTVPAHRRMERAL
jgi:ribosomal protein S18 acetylase RimI-like enzyme